jgi:predicted TIM-barrel fold metal-dependent hydrolase
MKKQRQFKGYNEMKSEIKLNRREILGAAMGIVSGAGFLAASEEEFPPIIDTHQHLWDRSKFRLKWIEKGSVLDRDFLTADYARATAGLGVVQAVYMEVDVVPGQHLAEAAYVSNLCKTKEGITRAAVVSGRPDSAEFATYLDQFRGNPFIKGLRQVLHGPGTGPDYCLRPEFVKGIRELGRRGLSFEICQREADLPNGVKLAKMCGETQFVLDHCGNPVLKTGPSDNWKKSIDAMAACANVSAKISGIIAGIDKTKEIRPQLEPFVDHVWDAFGPDRVVFGGDWPVCLLGGTYGEWVKTLRQIATKRSKADQKKLFHDNAIRIYRLT